ncbi:hypothetical protein TREES_T100001372 [Tupaia chinensis]|uniref:Uncharacterized protein n=1 Tax=Tupaia chinensis TaxID=246437 RepID=L9LCQ2_TUPCH|nr:hypothetical protein TREES_T100001372 [Tupaia chinensis]
MARGGGGAVLLWTAPVGDITVAALNDCQTLSVNCHTCHLMSLPPTTSRVAATPSSKGIPSGSLADLPAWSTQIWRPSRDSPFMVLMASEACSGLVKVIKPKPWDHCLLVLDNDLRDRPEATEVVLQCLLIGIEVAHSREELPFVRGTGGELES